MAGSTGEHTRSKLRGRITPIRRRRRGGPFIIVLAASSREGAVMIPLIQQGQSGV
jgi:hypothetical protein